MATAIGIIANQWTQHKWKEEGAPPGHAALCPNPVYEKQNDNEGRVDLLPRMRPDYMDKYEVRVSLPSEAPAVLRVVAVCLLSQCSGSPRAGRAWMHATMG